MVLCCVALCLSLGALSANALSLTGVQSRKTHLLGTGTFDLPIDTTQSMSGKVTVESRAIGAGHAIVFQFDGPIASTGALTVIDDTIASVAGATATPSGNDVVVTLSALADNKRVTIYLDNVNGVGLNVSASLGFRVGDTNNSGTVSAADVSSVKARAGQLASNANFQFDLDASGIVTASDISAVKARVGPTALPPGNAAPVVNAGANQTITLPAIATLAGTASDDGLPNPPGALTLLWTKFSGPSTVAFGNASAAGTTASFGGPGVYVLRLTADDSQRSTGADVTIVVSAPPTTSASLGPAGGTLDLTGPDGTVYMLEVPAGALARQATLSLTAFPPVGDQRFRVVVGPPGLVLEPGTAATLTVRLPAGHELAASGGLFSDGHPVPFTRNADGSVALNLRAISNLVAAALSLVRAAEVRRDAVPLASVATCGTPTAPSQGVTGADTVNLALYAQCMTAAIDELDRTGQFDAALAANLSVAALLQLIGGNGAGDAQSYLDAANATACRARSAAFALAASVAIDSMGELYTLLRPMAYWESVVQRLGAPCTVPAFSDAAGDLTTKALALYAANRPGVQDTGGALYHSTVAEAADSQTVRREVAALDPAPPVTATMDAQVKGRAERTLVEELLDGPWTACRNNGDYAPLMAVMDALASPDQAKDVAQYCGTAISVEGFTANPGATSLGTDGPVGDATRAGRKLSASLRATADGSVKLTGLARALGCPSGDESPEALVFTLNGHEVRRLAGPSYLGNAVSLDVAQLLTVAGLNPAALVDSVALTITRDGDACTGYWGTNPAPLLTLNLQSRPDRLVQVENTLWLGGNSYSKVVRVYKIEPTGTTVVFDATVPETGGIGEIYWRGAAYLRQQNHAVIGFGIQGGGSIGTGWGIMDASGIVDQVHPPAAQAYDDPIQSAVGSNGNYRVHNIHSYTCPDPEGACNNTDSIRVYENSSNAQADDFWPGAASHIYIAAMAVGPAGEVLFADSSPANQPPLLYVHTLGGANTLVGAYTFERGAFSVKGDKVYIDNNPDGFYEFDRAAGTTRKLSLSLVNGSWVAEPGGILYLEAGVLRRYDLASEQITTVGSLPPESAQANWTTFLVP